MLLPISLVSALSGLALAVPVLQECDPQPGESSYYSDYRGKADALPANITKAPILPTTKGKAGADDVLFQNLLSAEWAIYSFYQQGVERFNTSAFVDAGFPNTTYDRISEIRDNEAGHLAIFQAQISSSSTTPGACQYEYPYTDAASYLELQTLLEVSSMAFLTGLILQASLNASKAALLAISAVESRHNTWSLLDIWHRSPFAGPADTTFPYAHQILETTTLFIVPRSCPAANPAYPNPSQKLPQLQLGSKGSASLDQPGAVLQMAYLDPHNVPRFQPGRQYWLVAFHGLANHSMPFDVGTASAVVPEGIEPHKGIVVFVVADCAGAPTARSVLAGPLVVRLV